MPEIEKLYVLGHPVAHSKSPAMYNAVYTKLGLSWRYGLMDCGCVEDAEAFISAKDFLSINITMPYKPHALAGATARAASAKLAKGANLLVRKGDALIAYNTDGIGCISYLERCGVSFADARVVVCGTGPTSLAIMHAAAQAGASRVALIGRDAGKAQAVLDEYMNEFSQLASATIDLPAAYDHHRSFRETFEQAEFVAGCYKDSIELISAADVIIDATPLGMNPGDSAAFDTTLLHEDQTVLDVVYGHGQTPLATGAFEAGARFIDGSGMLVGQALATVRILCDVNEIDCTLSDDELFEIMAEAAGFECCSLR
ncbi:MAG: shikimate dehydrogenase [Eggerthellaceae bacterium]|nr:shikimate dehydrogenase [Eggerthellaceae bacterium]